jgi:hypothetical protein
MALRDEFLAEVDAFLLEAEMEPATFGRAALNDPSFVLDLRRDRSPNLRTIEKVRAFIAEFRQKAAA